jgi:hypothetical protein
MADMVFVHFCVSGTPASPALGLKCREILVDVSCIVSSKGVIQ